MASGFEPAYHDIFYTVKHKLKDIFEHHSRLAVSTIFPYSFVGKTLQIVDHFFCYIFYKLRQNHFLVDPFWLLKYP
jgi:hypothetical protein